MARLEADERESGGLRDVRLRLEGAGEAVPARLWLPRGEEARPLVLIQHPGMSGKDDAIVAGPARDWARAHGWACLALDAPGHGERASADPLAALRDPERAAALADRFAAEARAVVDAVAERYAVDAARLGYYGYSLGAMLGVAVVAGDGRYRAAVLAAAGEGPLSGPATGPGSRLPALASVAVRLIAKEGDELIAREATDALFAGLPGEKDLLTLPGGHFAIGDDVTRAAEAWLAARL